MPTRAFSLWYGVEEAMGFGSLRPNSCLVSCLVSERESWITGKCHGVEEGTWGRRSLFTSPGLLCWPTAGFSGRQE